MITERLDNITNIPVEYRTVMPPPPKSVKIEITGRCNYRCGFCPLSLRKGLTGDLDFKLFKKFIPELLEIGVKEIGVFFMGESFLTPDLLVNIINRLKCANPDLYIFLTSNGSVATRPNLYRVMKAGLDSLKWSCNFYDIRQFKKFTGAKETLFYDVTENIRSAYAVRDKHGFQTKLYASSIRYDDEQFEKMQEFLKDEILPYVDEHYWLPLYSMGSLAREKEKSLGLQPIAGNTGRYDNPVPPLPCWALFTEAHIMWDGRVTACCADATGEWVMGDLKTQTFMEIWHSKAFQKLRKKHLESSVNGTLCENCVMYK